MSVCACVCTDQNTAMFPIFSSAIQCYVPWTVVIK